MTLDSKIAKILGMPPEDLPYNTRNFTDKDYDEFEKDLLEYEKSTDYNNATPIERVRVYFYLLLVRFGNVSLTSIPRLKQRIDNINNVDEGWDILRDLEFNKPIKKSKSPTRNPRGKGWGKQDVVKSGIAKHCMNKLGIKLDPRRDSENRCNVQILQILRKAWTLNNC